MRINEISLINVVEREHYIKHHVDYMSKVMDEEPDTKKKENYNRGISMFKNTNWRRLILSKKTKDNLSNYKISKDIRYGVLRSLPNRTDSILVDYDTLIRYTKTDELMTVMFDRYDNKTKGLSNRIFYFDLINESVTLGMVDRNVKTQSQNMYETFIEEYFSLFMVVVTYLELTPVTLEIVESGRSTGTRKTFKIKNESDSNVIVVQTNWNEEKIDLRDINVRGHWRLQPYGSGLSKYKYIYIQPFKKGITRRLPQKELV